MKRISVLIIVVLITVAGQSQEKTIVINQVKQNENELFGQMYRYPQFVTGQAFHLTGSVTEAKFNYNYLTNRIAFIDAKGDTLALDLGATFSRIVIQADTFCYHNKIFIRQDTHYPSNNLFVKRSIRYADTQRKGAYGAYSSTSAVTSISQVNIGNQGQNLALDANLIYNFEDNYYISGRFNQFYPATKKGFYDLFPKKQKQIKEFIEKNNISFSKKEDIQKLLDFCRTLAE